MKGGASINKFEPDTGNVIFATCSSEPESPLQRLWSAIRKYPASIWWLRPTPPLRSMFVFGARAPPAATRRRPLV